MIDIFLDFITNFMSFMGDFGGPSKQWDFNGDGWCGISDFLYFLGNYQP